jgi:hypothetical protein
MLTLTRDLVVAVAGAVLFGAVVHALLTPTDPVPLRAALSSRTGVTADDCRAVPVDAPHWCRAAFYSERAR